MFPEEQENDEGHEEKACAESACDSCDLGSFVCAGVAVVGSCGAVGARVAWRGLVDEVVEPDVMRGVVGERRDDEAVGAVCEEGRVVEHGVKSARHDIWVGPEKGDGWVVIEDILGERQVVNRSVYRYGGSFIVTMSMVEGLLDFFLLIRSPLNVNVAVAGTTRVPCVVALYSRSRIPLLSQAAAGWYITPGSLSSSTTTPVEASVRAMMRRGNQAVMGSSPVPW